MGPIIFLGGDNINCLPLAGMGQILFRVIFQNFIVLCCLALASMLPSHSKKKSKRTDLIFYCSHCLYEGF